MRREDFAEVVELGVEAGHISLPKTFNHVIESVSGFLKSCTEVMVLGSKQDENEIKTKTTLDAVSQIAIFGPSR